MLKHQSILPNPSIYEVMLAPFTHILNYLWELLLFRESLIVEIEIIQYEIFSNH